MKAYPFETAREALENAITMTTVALNDLPDDDETSDLYRALVYTDDALDTLRKAAAIVTEYKDRWIANEQGSGFDTLGAAIRARRVKLGLSASDLAHHAGISVSYLSDIERDRTLPSLGRMAAIARSIGVSPADLLSNVKQIG